MAASLEGSATALVVVAAVPGTPSAKAQGSILNNISDELPYPPEKYPGKLCVLCNLGERSQLGQGCMMRIALNDNEPVDMPDPQVLEEAVTTTPVAEVNSSFEDSDSMVVWTQKRQKNGNKLKSLSSTSEYVDELEKIGHTEIVPLKSQLGDDNHFYVHRSCAAWTYDVTRNADGSFTGLQTAVTKALARKCAFCNRHGASLTCKMTCVNAFHFPCMTASGGFQMIQTYTCFCRDHIAEVPIACPNAEDIKCRTCSWSGDISNLMLCSKCGDHYHGACVGVAQVPGVRAGWQCSRCRHCHICRSDSAPAGTMDTRTVSCEHCDKIYHTQCVRPAMATVPKYGWKCRCCRVCVDCGSRSPGAGASSRWHQHYTVCDSCYQQRNKGYSCPVCHRAYRAMAQREMVKCSLCQKHVHSTCDPEADLAAYQAKKEASPDYEYVCSPCKLQIQTGRFVPSVLRRLNTVDEEAMSLQESLYAEHGDQEGVTDKLLLKLKSDFGLGKGKPLLAGKSAKKKFGLTLSKVKGKLGVQKRNRLVDLGRKRGPKAKMRGLFGVPGLGLQRPTSDKESAKKEDDEPGMENRLVLCSAKDKFVLTQDVCVMCGAVGTDQEGCLISCSQCGQCYHPYCVSVKVTKVILQKGWRCLDCTVCEGCGQRHDEARLLLCDDCDVSYHIYCMTPPLDIVPQGNWKCRWCAICLKCGRNEPGVNCAWMNSYTECGPCASQANCSVCTDSYVEGEFIVQCTTCDRWLHGACDAVTTEEEAEKCFDEGYACIQCRPSHVLPPHLKPAIKAPSLQEIQATSASGAATVAGVKQSPDDFDMAASALSFSLEGQHCVDGVCLSQHGLQQIKSLQLDSVRKKRRPREKEATILAAIESVVAGGSMDNSLEDIKMEPLDPKDEGEMYKDGMLWDRENVGPPEGFSLFTTETGAIVLRKKRQRNLQKVGIGGFTVRNRTMKSLKETLVKDDEVQEMMGQVPQITAGLEDKKKKAAKKKVKNKLIETYPSYLQEAFFGKELLGAKMKVEPDLSDDDLESSQKSQEESEDVAVKQSTSNKLSSEELKMIESIRAKQQQFEDQKQKKFAMVGQQMPQGMIAKTTVAQGLGPQTPQVGAASTQQSVGSAMQQNARSGAYLVKSRHQPPQQMAGDCVDASSRNRPAVSSVMPQTVIKTEVMTSTSGMDANFTDLLDTIINDDNDLLEGMDDIINGVFTDESQESQQSMTMSSNESSSSQMPKTNMPQSTLSMSASLADQLVVGHANQQQPQAVSQLKAQSGVMVVADQQQQMSVSGEVLQQQPQVMHMSNFDAPNRTGIVSGQATQTHPGINRCLSVPHADNSGGQQMMQQGSTIGTDYTTMQDLNNAGNQWNPMCGRISTPMDPELSMAGDDQMAPSTGPVNQTNNQKASERMRLDETLGEMATSAPVLYANTHHPELKVEYPNWTDRHKQIIKRWRGLSVDIKTPFNQKARENRTTLRMKKTQQIAAQSSPKDNLTNTTNTTSPPSPSSSSLPSSSVGIGGGGIPAVGAAPNTISLPLRQISHVQLQQLGTVGQLQPQQQQLQVQPCLQPGTSNQNYLGEILQHQHPQQLHQVAQQHNMNEVMMLGGRQQGVHLQQQQQQQQPFHLSHATKVMDGGHGQVKNRLFPSHQNQIREQHHHDGLPSSNTEISRKRVDQVGGTGETTVQQLSLVSPATSLTVSLSSSRPNQNNNNNCAIYNHRNAPTTNTTLDTPFATASTSTTNTTNSVIMLTSTTSTTTNSNLSSAKPGLATSPPASSADRISPSLVNMDNLIDSSSSPTSFASSPRDKQMSSNNSPSVEVTCDMQQSILGRYSGKDGSDTSDRGGSDKSGIIPETGEGKLGEVSNVNIVVTAKPTNSFMKNIPVGGGVARSPGMSQFVIHQPAPHYHTLLHSGPAPNVTVNPNGNFQTNPNATVRATYTPYRAFSPFQGSFGRVAGGSIQCPAGVQSPILAAQLQTINQIASAQMGQVSSMPLPMVGIGGVDHLRKNAMPIYVSTTLAHQRGMKGAQGIVVPTTTTLAKSGAMITSTSTAVEMAKSKANCTEGYHLSPMSSSTVSPISASSSPTLLNTKTVGSVESSTPSPQSSNSSIVRSVTPPSQPDQNIRVLTPSEIMRTLPSMLSQDAATTNFLGSPDHVDRGGLMAHRGPGLSYHQMHSADSGPAMDQEKLTAQQKSLRDQENERQWKLLQARAREQQMQQQIVLQGNELSQSPHDPSIMGLQSPTGFLPPANKGRPGNFQQSGMIRPVSVQIPRQRMGQNPFSPQSQSSQSPMEQYPSSPNVMDMVTHSPSEQAQQDSLTQSPHTPRSFDMQSPNSGLSRSPAYSAAGNSAVPTGATAYAMPPGTPRPGQSTGQSRPTVYARDMFGGQFPFSQDPYGNNNGGGHSQQMSGQHPNANMQQPHDGNRQLRDLLQRQQHSAPNSPSVAVPTTPTQSNWNLDSGTDNQVPNQQQVQQQQPGQMVAQNITSDNTFRLPLPPGATIRPQRIPIVNQGMMRGPNVAPNSPRPVQIDIRQRMIRPKNMQSQLPIQQQQPQFGQSPNQMAQFGQMRMQGGELMVNNPQVVQQQHVQHRRQQQQMASIDKMVDDQTTTEQQEVAMIAEKLESLQHNMGSAEASDVDNRVGGTDEPQSQRRSGVVTGAASGAEAENPEIPDNVTADLETLEQDGYGEDLFDEDFLLSGDFNILEYADPELDTIHGEDQSNLLDSLELDEPDNGEKEGEKTKKDTDLNAFIGSDQVATSTSLAKNPSVLQATSVHQAMSQGTVNKESMPQGNQQQQHTPHQGPVHFQNTHLQQMQVQQQPQRSYQMKQPLQIPPNIQHIQQTMINQIQQSAAMGKIIQPGTQFSSNGVIGTVTANNQIQFSYTGVLRPQIQQMRMVSGGAMGQPRIAMAQGNRMPVPAQSHDICQQQQQQQPGQQPPPPYPIPPPPYPGNAGQAAPHSQEQPLLLEDLLEQEKREQERQQQMDVTGGTSGDMNQHNMEQGYQRTASMEGGGFPANQLPNMGNGQMTGMVPGSNQQQLQQQSPVTTAPTIVGGQQVRAQMMARAGNQTQWRMPNPNPPPPSPLAGTPQIAEPPRQVPVFPLQPAPPVPPENLINDKDRQMHLAYDQWLTQQNIVLGDQLKYFETEVGKLRKAKKFLNTKQRQAKKTGGELSEVDAAELVKVSNEQSIIQKQLESARKQARQHNILLQDYRSKRNNSNPVSSPATAPPSPLMSPSPMIQHSVQSPLNNPMISAAQSPLHSPSLMMTQSPGSANINQILQSPNNQANAMSPYNTMQSSPRIGTPLMEENPFSPSGGVGPSASPSLSARLTSPSPRMTSPQHRPQIVGNRVLAGPGGMQFQQQQTVNNQQMIINLGNGQNQARFARPHLMQQGGEGIRQRIVINTAGQQQPHQMFISSPIGQQQHQDPMAMQSPMNMGGGGAVGGVVQMGQQMQSNAQLQMGPQRALIQQRQQILQHQILSQPMAPNQQGQTIVQQQQYQKQSPIHQPQSPMINQMTPVSPMHVQQGTVPYGNAQGVRMSAGQQQQSQQQQQQMAMMDNNQRNIYLQQQQMHHDVDPNQQMQQLQMPGAGGSGGGVVGPHNPIPLPESFFKHGYIKLGLFGGAPVFPFGRGAKRMPVPSTGQTGSVRTPAANKVTVFRKVRSTGPVGDATKPTKTDVVVIDSSPDDKQRIMDYDDDNDKAVVQEVSLSAAAAAHGDDASVIETFSTGEFVASPLEPDVTEEYVLFGQEYEEFVESDDDMKGLKNALKPIESGSSSRNVDVVDQKRQEYETSNEFLSMGSQEFIIETGDENGSPCEGDVKDIIVATSQMTETVPIESEQVAADVNLSLAGTSMAAAVAKDTLKMGSYPVRVAANSSPVTASRHTTGVVHNKLVKDATQGTAIVSIGNTTISVPLLKSVPMSHTKTVVSVDQQQATTSNSVANKKIVTKAPINLSKFNLKNKLNPGTLVSLSPLTISNAKRMVQASLLRTSMGQTVATMTTPIGSSVAAEGGSNTVGAGFVGVSATAPTSVTPVSVLDKLSTKIKSPSLSYSKVSSLTVSQSSLPEKIFQDDVSPDNSVEHEDHDLLATATSKEKGSDELVDEQEKKSTIPCHVIVKTKEHTSSGAGNTLSVPQGTTQRLMSVMPQLSPLSQPSEMSTNMQNASQQLRNIMSSLNTTTVAVTSQQGEIVDGAAPVNTTAQTIVQKGTADVSIDGIEKRVTKGQGPSMVKVPPKTTNVQLITKNIDASKFSHIINAQSLGPQAAPGIVVVKQVRSGQRTTLNTMKQHLVRSVKPDAVESSSVMVQGVSSGSGQTLPNLTKIQQNLQKEGNKAVIQFNSVQPPALVITTTTTRSIGVPLSSTATVTTAGGGGSILPVVTVGAASNKPSTLMPLPFTGSILSATLTKPHLKQSQTTTTTNVKTTNTLLQSQLTSPPFRRSKSTDEPPLFLRESPAPINHGTKRLSLELSNLKTEPAEGMEIDVRVSSSTAVNIENSTAPTGGCKSSTVTSTVPKSEESQHVLLKQLLQNSSSPSSTSSNPLTPAASQAIVSRTGPVLRAPSLGLFGSLEQQLSRPAILPAPASQVLNCPPAPKVTVTNVATSTSTTQSANSTNTQSVIGVAGEAQKFQVVQSKETSFLSKPSNGAQESRVVPKVEIGKIEDAEATPTTTVNVSTTPSSGVNTSTVSVNTVVKTPTEPPPPYHLSAINIVPPPNVVIKKEMSSVLPDVLQAAQQPHAKTSVQKFLGVQRITIPSGQSQQTFLGSGGMVGGQPAPPQSPQHLQQIQNQHLPNNFNNMLSSPPINVQNPLMSPLLSQNSQSSSDIKKELIDDSSQQSAASDQSKSESSKNECMDTSTESCLDTTKMQVETAADIKKRKRREYQKNRRQMQQNPKESGGVGTGSGYGKKKQKRLAKFEEDYDTFIDGMMIQLRQLPSMEIVEPELCRNFGICNPFGAGDLAKLNSVRKYGIAKGDLTGEYGASELQSDGDFYNTTPFGEKSSVKGVSATTHYGFYDQEFSQLWFDVEDELKAVARFEPVGRDKEIGTPDTVISSSSPECTGFEPIPNEFPSLLDADDVDGAAQLVPSRSISPAVPIIVPVPIRLKGSDHSGDRVLRFVDASNKEDELCYDKPVGKGGIGGQDGDNVTVTLTLSSSVAEDIIGVLKDLANILHMPAPTQYDIVERSRTPPTHRLGLYRAKDRDGKALAPVDIQTILHGSVRLCSNCEIVILKSAIRAKSKEFPLEKVEDEDSETASTDPFASIPEVFFCSSICYKQYKWRSSARALDEDCNAREKSEDCGRLSIDSITIRQSIDLDMNDEDLKMEVDLDDTELKEVAGGIDLKDLGEIKSQDEDDDDMMEDDLSTFSAEDGRNSQDAKQSRRSELDSDVELEPPRKQHRGLRYKFFAPNCFKSSPSKYRKPTEKEITETLFRMNITVTAGARIPDDTRKCIFCHQTGDGVADGPSRLLNFDVDKWVHLNCALWSEGVYETVNGALMNLEAALQSSLTQTCIMCNEMGATIKCFKPRCTNLYHLGCAMKDQCVFYKNKTTMCASHAPKAEKDNELTTLSVQRRVYVDRDESRQVASVMHHSELSNLLRVGSLIFLNVGQLLPHQLVAFHTPNYIYPIGYKIIRFYWSMREPNKRCRYICSIADTGGRPEFRVTVQEPNKEDIELRDTSPRTVWQRILEPLAEMRRDNKIIQLFPKYVTGEDLFGLTEPAVVRILESLPGIETLPDYRFKYGRNPLLELPLAINPSGAARTEPKLKQNVGWKKPHTQRTGSSQRPVFVPTATIAGEVACPYSKQFVHSKSSQYKKMKQEWRNNVFLARSKIQGLGLYAARDLEKHTMVIEYIGEVIRTEVSEFREKQYEAKNRGIYMFRLDEDRVVDATLSGGLARYINHSCNPNCVTEIVEVDREFRIIIFAKRRINRGEELSYDYKFDIEDDAHKISCMCGAPNCKKWMN